MHTPNKQLLRKVSIKNNVNIQNGESITTKFTDFGNREKRKAGIVKKQLTAIPEWANISFIVLKNFSVLYPVILENLSTTELYIDFSENLTIPLTKQPHSMYWVANQVTGHSGKGW